MRITVGKRSGVAEKIFYGALDEISSREQDVTSLEIFRAAIENVMPSVEVKSRRVGGSTYQVPMEVRHNRSESLAIRWLIPVSYTHLTLPTILACRSRWSPYH